MKKPITSAKTEPRKTGNAPDIHIIATRLSAKGRPDESGRTVVELARHWAESGAAVTVHTNHDGYLLGQESGLRNVVYSVWVTNRWRRLGAPIMTLFQGAESVARAHNIKTSGVILSATSTWTDVLAAQRIKRYNPDAKWVCPVKAIKPWRGSLRSRPGQLAQIAAGAALANQIGRDADLVFALSDNRLDGASAQSGGRAFALRPGIDLWAPAAFSKPRKKYDCIFMAAGETKDGWMNLAKMWRHTTEYRPGSRLAVIVEGDARALLRAKRDFTRWGPAGNVAWLRNVAGTERQLTLSASKVLVAPFSDYGWTAVDEAMAAGVPVIGYDTPVLRLNYPQGRLMVPEGDWASLGRLLMHVLDNRGLYLRLKRETKSNCAGRDWRTCAAETLDFIQSAA